MLFYGRNTQHNSTLETPLTELPPRMKMENKLEWIDNLKAFGLATVVWGHVTVPICYQFGKVSSLVWLVVTAAMAFSRFCVPVFVMVTGALLLPKEYELFTFLKRRLVRVVIPFALWSLVYIAYDLIDRLGNNNAIEFLPTVKWIVYQIENGSAEHLWYIYVIVGLYLISPIIGRWIRHCGEKEILYFLAVWFYLLVIEQPFLSKFEIQVDLHYFFGYVGYLVLGYYLSQKSFVGKRINAIAILALIIGGAITSIGTFVLTYNSGKFEGAFQKFLSPNVMLTAVAVFVLLKNNKLPVNKFLGRMRDFLSLNSLGIYLIHLLIIRLLNIGGISCNLVNPIIGISITTIACLSISIIIVYVIKKLPYGKYILG
jgi:surface polysaccharide O-acyltransferase-like enzyme